VGTSAAITYNSEGKAYFVCLSLDYGVSLTAMLRLLRWCLASGRSKSGADCVLLFRDSSEVRWFDEVPRRGTHVRGPAGRVRVIEVLQSGRNVFTVVCGRRDGPPDAPPLLATELLEVARRKVAERRRSSRYRPFTPPPP
jgi:hypothetical protein